MMKSRKPLRRASQPALSNPHPIRFDPDDMTNLRTIADGMGIGVSQVARMAVRHSLRKFLSGEVTFADVMENTSSRAA